MPKEFSRRTAPPSVKDWLTRLDSEEKANYAEAYLSGEEEKGQENNLEEVVSEIRDASKVRINKPSLLQRIRNRQKPDNEPTAPPDPKTEQTNQAVYEGAVEQRLAGMELPKIDQIWQEAKGSRKSSPSLQSAPVKPPEKEPPQPERKVLPITEENHSNASAIEKDEDSLRTIATTDWRTTVETGERKMLHPLLRRIWNWFDELPKLYKILMVSAPVLLLAGAAVVILLTRPHPEPVPPASIGDLLDPSIPVPLSLVLPNTQIFELTPVLPNDLLRRPKSAEWFAGTEVPRWLVLPWQRKLQNAISGFHPGDTITLKMSNGENLQYSFNSLEKVPVQQLPQFHANSADLLIVLATSGGQQRFVVVATP